MQISGWMGMTKTASPGHPQQALLPAVANLSTYTRKLGQNSESGVLGHAAGTAPAML